MAEDDVEQNEPNADEPQDVPSLAETLLQRRVASHDGGRRWAYPLWGIILVSAFVAYHATVLIVHNTPSKGLSRGLHTTMNKRVDANRYMRAVGSSQSWAMFAPNPHRANQFMKVLVQDQAGDVWNMAHDMYGRRSYPYFFYSRMGKINRRIIDQKGYRRHYAAWVCRTWEKDHDGEMAEEVRFVKMWSRVPPPKKVYPKPRKGIWRMGFDPMKLHLNQREEETFRCKSTRHAQLPPRLRERYGMPEAPEGHFREVKIRTWVDQKRTEEKRTERQTSAQSARGPKK